ncbi:hypothetical protein R3P38DRAFT_3234999 [Favolaschia claudopus]|uniref:Uncharacterized protein n=1 Tax=Favolaschia claudopus TaxID=2862362 RepID=A0AAV9ZFW2_9AGAR
MTNTTTTTHKVSVPSSPLKKSLSYAAAVKARPVPKKPVAAAHKRAFSMAELNEGSTPLPREPRSICVPPLPTPPPFSLDELNRGSSPMPRQRCETTYVPPLPPPLPFSMDELNLDSEPSRESQPHGVFPIGFERSLYMFQPQGIPTSARRHDTYPETPHYHLSTNLLDDDDDCLPRSGSAFSSDRPMTRLHRWVAESQRRSNYRTGSFNPASHFRLKCHQKMFESFKKRKASDAASAAWDVDDMEIHKVEVMTRIYDTATAGTYDGGETATAETMNSRNDIDIKPVEPRYPASFWGTLWRD